VTVREYRFQTGTKWGTGSFQNKYTQTQKQMTIANRFFGVFDVKTRTNQDPIGGRFDPYGLRVDFEQPGTRSTIRVLALGHHNHVWQTGDIP
jgi:hypothetical protein